MRDRGAPQYAILDVAVWAVPFGIIGARIYNVATSWQVYFGKGGTGCALDALDLAGRPRHLGRGRRWRVRRVDRLPQARASR